MTVMLGPCAKRSTIALSALPVTFSIANITGRRVLLLKTRIASLLHESHLGPFPLETVRSINDVKRGFRFRYRQEEHSQVRYCYYSYNSFIYIDYWKLADLVLQHNFYCFLNCGSRLWCYERVLLCSDDVKGLTLIVWENWIISI